MNELTWSAPEYLEQNRSTDWYWGVGLVALIAAGAAVFFGNYLFAVLIAVGAFSLILFAQRKPEHIEYSITERGIRINSLLYPYNSLDSFWVDENEHDPKILLASKKFFLPYIIIPLYDHDPREVRDILLAYLPEVEHHEPLLQILAERLGL